MKSKTESHFFLLQTGTLTEEGLDMWAVIPIDSKSCKPPVRNVHTLERDHLLFGMLTCHSLTKIDGKLTGDPLDVKVFIAIQILFAECKENVQYTTKYLYDFRYSKALTGSWKNLT